jgi:hypothetical protein
MELFEHSPQTTRIILLCMDTCLYIESHAEGTINYSLLVFPCTFRSLFDLSLSPARRTANEGPMRIKYRCLVPIYVFPEMKLYGLVISKTDF